MSPQKSSSAGTPLRTQAVQTEWKIQYSVCGETEIKEVPLAAAGHKLTPSLDSTS